jgi:hypothetical protein
MNAEQASEDWSLAFKTLVSLDGKVKLSRTEFEAAEARLETAKSKFEEYWEKVAYVAWDNFEATRDENP